jgi:hypothetical protein
MKQAISVSLGSTRRNKAVDVRILDEEVHIERIGTDGDVARAVELFHELDGKVDAFGVGGMDLGVHTPWRFYPIYDALRLVRDIKHTPYVDGGGLKETLEAEIAQVLERECGAEVEPKRVLLVAAITRYGMTLSFERAGYQCVYGDLMFALGMPIPVTGLRRLGVLARLLLPIIGRLPMKMLYPTGQEQEENVPKYTRWYDWATVIAGDFLYIKRHMPERLDGKVVVTNTTTEADVKLLRQRGVKLLVTSTPVFDGRSFGTNMLEAALVAAAGKGRALTHAELAAMLAELRLEPQVQRL